jgi:hypothetical protein
VKAAWRNLDTTFGRELTKCVVRHSGEEGDDADDLYTGDWAFFGDLKFLRDSMTGRSMSGTIASSEQQEQESIVVTEDYSEHSQSPKEPDLPEGLAETDLVEDIIIEEEQELFEHRRHQVCLSRVR